MNIQLNQRDCKEIADNVEKKNTPLEQCLARKYLVSLHSESALKAENTELKAKLFSLYNSAMGGKWANEFAAWRKSNLQAASHAAFTAAVNLNAAAEEISVAATEKVDKPKES